MVQKHGVLLINKPSGMTSHDVVHRVRRKLGIKEVGHAGTLDPMAEGLMVLLLGEATKLSAYILEQDKYYEVTLRLGLESDTLDSTGQILKEAPVNVGPAEVHRAAQSLEGDWLWDIPRFSAKKVNGEKLYEQARRGETPESLPQKWMKFWAIEPLDRNGMGTEPENAELEPRVPTHYRFRLRCSKGSFIRSWVHALGQSLGCGALMCGLKRLESAPYSLERAVELDALGEEGLALNSSPSSFVPLLGLLPSMKSIRVGGYSEGLIRNGQISHELRRQLISLFDPDTDQSIKIISQRPEELLAIVGLEKDKGFVVRRVFRY